MSGKGSSASKPAKLAAGPSAPASGGSAVPSTAPLPGLHLPASRLGKTADLLKINAALMPAAALAPGACATRRFSRLVLSLLRAGREKRLFQVVTANVMYILFKMFGCAPRVGPECIGIVPPRILGAPDPSCTHNALLSSPYSVFYHVVRYVVLYALSRGLLSVMIVCSCRSR